MRFSARNLYYLRISATAVLPLYLYLDEQHIDWMSEHVLQHVLEDLRPLIPNKLISEADAYLGLGGPVNAKRGTVEVHRGDTYQFGYFLKNTEPHALVIKTRKFTARPRLATGARSSAEENPQPIRSVPEEASQNQNKRKRTSNARKRKTVAQRKRNAKGKGRPSTESGDNEQEAIETTDEDISGFEEASISFPNTFSAAPRRSTRRRVVIAGSYVETHENDVDIEEDTEIHIQDRTRASLTAEEPQPRTPVEAVETFMQLDDAGLIAMGETEDITPAVKTEDAEPIIGEKSHPADVSAPIVIDDEPPVTQSILDGPADILPAEDDEEEDKPKPVMSLNYKGFNIHGRCLCVIVEPYPPIRQQRTLSLEPTGLAGPRAPSIAPPDFVSSGGAGQRARTPLFFPDPDYDRDRSVTPAPVQFQRARPPVPLFNEEPAQMQDEEPDGGMLAFSQILQSVSGYSTGAVEDDDEMDGSVFLGDADEAKEL